MGRHIRKRRDMKAQQKHDNQCNYALRMLNKAKTLRLKTIILSQDALARLRVKR